MNRKSIGILALSFVSLAGVTFAGWSAGPSRQDTSKDRSAIKADGAKSAADEKEVKRLSDLLAQATSRSKQAHEAYVQKLTARESATKSFGAKDSRTAQASKDEAAAKQEWVARMKDQQDIAAQRKAAIQKLHGADTADSQDVHKLESDEGKQHPKSATKTSTTPKK